MELALTWLFQNTESETVLIRKLAQEGGSSVLFGRDTRESNQLHKIWRRSRFFKDVDKLLSGEQLVPGEDPFPRSEEDDSELEGEQPVLQEQVLPPPEDVVSPSAHFMSPRVASQVQQSGFVPHSAFAVHNALQPQPAATTKLPDSTWRLLEVYHAYTQSWLPICEKHDLLRVSYSYPDTGLVLSIDRLLNHADHAELWSVLAVAAFQEYTTVQDRKRDLLSEYLRLYNIARTLIPTESGSFAAGHVRALLNLAVINISTLRTEVAWLLVGSASRILSTTEKPLQAAPARRKHLLAGCFMFDSFLSLQLNRRPYFFLSDVLRAGKVEEDGLEEWQPWNGPLHRSPDAFVRTPALSLSTFNSLTEVVDILIKHNLEGSIEPQVTRQQTLRQLESWKVSLSSKFNYVGDEPKATPFNPPAVLLQLTYLCCAYSVYDLPMYVHSMLDLMEHYLAQVGGVAVPPVVLCLLAHVQSNRTFNSLDLRIQGRIRKFEADLARTSLVSPSQTMAPTPSFVSAQAGPTGSTYQVPTPDSIQVPLNGPFSQAENNSRSDRTRTSASLLDDLLPDMNSAVSANHQQTLNQDSRIPPPVEGFHDPSMRHRNSVASRDLETFFDELASLDGAEMVDNQPQFMQNLGFAPDANMADFLALGLGQYVPANSSTLLPSNNDSTHLDPVFFDES